MDLDTIMDTTAQWEMMRPMTRKRRARKKQRLKQFQLLQVIARKMESRPSSRHHQLRANRPAIIMTRERKSLKGRSPPKNQRAENRYANEQ